VGQAAEDLLQMDQESFHCWGPLGSDITQRS
jgi:hypothetical protein